MRKWWRGFKHKYGWDFKCHLLGVSHYYRCYTRNKQKYIRVVVAKDEMGCYDFTCNYCGMQIKFPGELINLAMANMQRHIRAKHDVL